MRFQLTEEAIDPAEWRARMLSRSAGAYSYEGWVRDNNEGKPVSALHYRAYAELAGSVGESILDEAEAKFRLEAAALVHRVGPLRTGDVAVWVGVIAHHRDESFLGCRYIIDNVKHRLPIWKKEVYADGSEGWISSNPGGDAESAKGTP